MVMAGEGGNAATAPSRRATSLFLFQRLQFALRRKVPLGNAATVSPHERRGAIFGQLEEFFCRFQITLNSLQWVDHCVPLHGDIQHRTATEEKRPLWRTAFL